MRSFQLLSLVLFIISGTIFSSCQEDEAAILDKYTNYPVNPPTYPKIPTSWQDPYRESEEVIAESVLSSDRRTTEIIGNPAHLFLRIRPKGCPRRFGPICEPGFEFSLSETKGIDPRRFLFGEMDSGVIVDPKTKSVVAYFADVYYDPESEAITLFYTQGEASKIASDQLQVSFGTLLETDKSVEEVRFEGEVTSKIIEYLP